MEETNVTKEDEQVANEASGSEAEKPQREMYKATCADCGKEAEVPFKPEEGRPVRCNECFRKNRPQRKSNRFDRGPREMHKATCADCGKEAEVPFKPTEGKPVYCRDCYMKKKQ